MAAYTSSCTPVTQGVPPPGAIARVAIGDFLRRSAARDPHKTVFVLGKQRMSYGEFNDQVTRCANALLAQGLTRGDRVATLCNNSLEFLIAMFGIHRAGLIWVPINTGLGLEDVRYILEHSEARFVLVDAALFARPELRDLLQAQPGRGWVLEGEGSGSFSAFAPAIAAQSAIETEVELHDRDVAQIMYTSGTTGRPKGVMQSHLSVVMAAMNNAIEFGLWRDAVNIAVLPLFHCAQHTLMCGVLAAGGTVIVMRAFDPGAVLDAIENERVTFLIGLPLMHQAILDHPSRPGRDLSSLRMCVYAMAPMPETLLRRLIAEICPNYALGTGQTEMYPLTMAFRPEEQLRRFGSYWGVSALINDTAVMDDQGNILGPNEVGEIVHRGPNVMEGYYKNPEATAEARAFGWHHTGDLGMWIDGQMMFKDRKKDMIKTGGENVPSVKVEAVLLRHPAVANAAAVGLPHQRWIEAVTAFVTLKPGAQVDEATLIAHCKEHLGAFEVPKSIRIVDALPMTSTGKVQKHPLREKYRHLYELEN
ncbi:AMP-binding protein [Extensimonas vulgaris]|uniref:Long-chain acyl-CoA synthetase n=1 Tax=Extensimonas vulgaris TaxID=1031594 RepID=A0A369AKQ3_9BURK|nr:AMP-binding protein [Extensimonas vulgaris]RCX09693.1 long-chain acyl-CoA synthetase [Extensimonas vulgaris]TWI39323.1 long-chain acyl-CoA synthetase [Extensimonas vulgaris]TXD15573.1 AMP-binding protein [Extensimonas vulgaris]